MMQTIVTSKSFRMEIIIERELIYTSMHSDSFL